MALTVTVGVTDITSAVDLASLSVESSGLALGTASFRVTDVNNSITAIVPEAEVTIVDNGTTIFGGLIRTRTLTRGVANRYFTVGCQDYTSLLTDDVIDDLNPRSTVESDKQRIEYLLTTYGSRGVGVGSTVATLMSDLPEQTFTGMTLYEAVQSIGNLTGGRFYVGYDKNLYYFLTESVASSWNFSDAPNFTTTYPYHSLTLPDDTVELVNAVFVVGDGVSGWVTDATSITNYGRREGSLNDPSLTTAEAVTAAGTAYLLGRSEPRQPASLHTDKGGLRAGMTVLVTDSVLGLSSTQFSVVKVTAKPVTATLMDYEVQLGDGIVDLPSIFSGGAAADRKIANSVNVLNSIDTTPPGVPTGLTLSSALVESSDATSFVRLTASLTHPTDADLFASVVEITATSDGDESDPQPDWTSPLVMLIGKEATSGTVDGVAGGTLHWARAYAIDISGNESTKTAVQSITTAADSDAPAVPTGLTAAGGYRGIGASWNPSGARDISFYEFRYAPDLAGAPDTASWSYGTTLSSKLFISGLDTEGDGSIYWFTLRAVDRSGNVATSEADPTAVFYSTNPEAGWATPVSATAVLIGATDIAARSITAEHINAAGLSADVITSGVLNIQTTEASSADGISVWEGVPEQSAEIGRWDEDGLFVRQASNTSNYVRIHDGGVTVYRDGVEVSAMTPDGINASAITFGSLPGGHNLILNSSYEMADFVSAESSVTFTDASGTPGWKSANRVTTPDNLTEGTSLTMTSVAA